MLQARQTLANNLKYLMSCSDHLDTQQRLETKSSVGQSTIGRILRGSADAGIDTVEKLAKAFKLTAYDLMDPCLIDRTSGKDSNIRSSSGLYSAVPLISWVTAGMLDESMDLLATNDAEEWLQCPYPHSNNSFCLQIKGLSMAPDYRDGEIILVDPMVEVRHNSDVVVRTPEPDGKTTFKRLQITDDGMFLLALNVDFPNRIIEMPEGTKICGVVTGSWMRRR
ncbi:MAG: putative HTH-type transcriptional regulator [Pseudomonas sp.]|nr:MAG: putative HTH-type transcriptional regulator [Pseudomonas sp.]